MSRESRDVDMQRLIYITSFPGGKVDVVSYTSQYSVYVSTAEGTWGIDR